MPSNLTESALKKSEGVPLVVPSKRTRATTEIDPNVDQQVCIDDEEQALKIDVMPESKPQRNEVISKLEIQ